MNLLIITQKVDENDPILGFFHRWIEEFGKHFDKITVICLEKRDYTLPSNIKVLSLGKEEGQSRIKYILNFYKYIIKEKDNYDSVFVHMNQVYILLGGILWKAWNKKIGLWYVHRQKSFSLWLATLFADVIMTSGRESFGYPSPKVAYMGHGIDIEKFKKEIISTISPRKILYIGRLSKIKDLETFIGSIEILEDKFPNQYEGILVGEAITSEDIDYKKSLQKLIEQKKLTQKILFLGAKSADEIPALINDSWATVNLSPTGGMDKTVLESLASGRPVFCSNLAFKELFSEYGDTLLFTYKNPQNLTLKVENFEKNPLNNLIVKNLSDKVRREYDVGVLIKKISTTLHG